ncbi:MAG: ABC transporter permease subunit [Thermoleophilia bacterium]
MTTAIAIAGGQLRSLMRRRTFVVMLLVLLSMTAASGFIGWSSHSTIISVYDETVRTLTAAGKPAPPDPFAGKPRLALLNNMIIYVPLIGALLAIVIGHLGVTDDRIAGVNRIVFSRPVPRATYYWGKLAGGALALLAIVTACLLLSVIAVSLINGGPPTAAELLRLGAFYGLAWMYLLVFMLVGMAAALLLRSQSTALLAAVAVWVLVTFATPQFTSGLRPVASLNPVNDPVAVSASPFFRATSKAKPVSVSEQYKTLSTQILTEGHRFTFGATLGHIAPILAFGALLMAWSLRLVRRYDFSEEAVVD